MVYNELLKLQNDINILRENIDVEKIDNPAKYKDSRKSLMTSLLISGIETWITLSWVWNVGFFSPLFPSKWEKNILVSQS